MLNDKKGFTLIEVLTVIAIFGIIVLLAAPRFLGYTEHAKLAQIKNDVKSYEVAMDLELLNNKDFIKDWSPIMQEELDKMNSSGKLIDKRGKNPNDLGENSFIIDKSEVKVNSKLKGNFIWTNKEQVYYYDESAKSIEDKNESDSDFIWIKADEGDTDYEGWEDDYGYYTAVNEEGYGYYLYVGDDEVVTIPDEINGNPMTSYYKMFSYNWDLFEWPYVLPYKKIISTNKNIVDMNEMFMDSNTSSLDLSELDTSNVKNMSWMLGWTEIVDLDISNFDTSNVTNMEGMFYGFGDNSELDVTHFDTSNVTNMASMFRGVSATSLDVSNFDTSEVTNMTQMFSLIKVPELDVSNFNTSKVTNMYEMFRAVGFSKIDVSNFDTSNVENMGHMFYWGDLTEIIGLENFDTSNVVFMTGMFGASKVTTLNLRNFDTSNVTNMSSMFEMAEAKTLDLSSFDTSKVESMAYMFKYAHATSILGIEKLDTSNAYYMTEMFQGSKLPVIDLRSFTITESSYYSRNMFQYATATLGYARTQEDADRLNSTSNKPYRLTFVVK